MNTVAKIYKEAVPTAANNLIINTMAVICGLGLIFIACIAAPGLDMSAGFF